MDIKKKMRSKTLYLLCNAHLDPVWLWEWEEGAAEALSTFRMAASLCEEFEEFVFNHNEALLYQWVETYEPELFVNIQELVKKRKWHVMGGWYLQPDCNMPSGESLVRHILQGRLYFRRKFGEEPKTAANLDSFGHSRGLVQILKKSGYTSYLFCRPDKNELTLPADDFVWVGYDGSEIFAHRARDHYNSERGKASEKVIHWIEENPSRQTGLLLWGIGNHGGGPSREDIKKLRDLNGEKSEWKVCHATPEAYFEKLDQNKECLSRHVGDLNPWAVGCYTTMALVKQKHRLLENMYFLTEKMVTHAALQKLIHYPRKKLNESLEDLLFCEFHDVLPGSSISEVETYALQRMDHALEILSRLKARAFFSLLSGQHEAQEGEFPIFVYNSHPYPVNETIVCEFQPAEPNFNRNIFWLPEIFDSSHKPVPFQLEKESSNVSIDHRKRVVFRVELEPGRMNRFSCWLNEVKAGVEIKEIKKEPFVFRSDKFEISVNPKTGFMDSYVVNGIRFLNPDSFCPLVIEDYSDPWGMKVHSFRNIKGHFTLMTGKEAARFAGVSSSELKPVRIIEDGPVRTVVESLFKHGHSSMCMQYKIPKKGSEFEVKLRVYWNEKDRMLKLSIPTPFTNGDCKGQVAYGVESHKKEKDELVVQKWVGMISSDRKHALTVINEGIHGFDYGDGELRLSLLRSAAYSGHPVGEGISIVPQDRFEARIDQGERVFRFWVNGGDAAERFELIDREALIKNEPMVVLSCSPPGTGKNPSPTVQLSDGAVLITAVKMAEEHNWMIIRLFEPTGKERPARIVIPYMDLAFNVSLNAFEIKTMAVDLDTREIFEVDLMENKVST